MFIRWTFTALLAAVGFTAAILPGAAQQDYPNRPIRIIVGFQAGSSSDVAARVVSQKLSEILKSAVVVENRPGASSDVAAKAVAAAAPDGYTLYLATVANTINFVAKGQAATDVASKLAPLAQIGEVPNILVVNPDVQARTVADVIRLAKEKPGELPYASVGSGSALHMAAELFSTMTGVRLLHVPYQGSAAAMADLLTGRTSLMFAPASTVLEFVKSGKLRDRVCDEQAHDEHAGASDRGRAGPAGLRIVGVVWNFGTARIAGADCEDAGNGDPAGDGIARCRRAIPDAKHRRDPARPGRFYGLCQSGNEKWAKVIQTRGLKLD